EQRCKGARASADWTELASCATDLKEVDAGRGAYYSNIAHLESQASTAKARLDTELSQGNLDAAKKQYDLIAVDTTPKADADKEWNAARNQAVAAARKSAASY